MSTLMVDTAVDIDDSVVVISLLDFQHKKNSTDHQSDQLKKRMRNYRKLTSFSMKFEPVHTIIIPQINIYQTAYPYDIKLSYAHNCICVSDQTSAQLFFMDLESREFISSFKTLKDLACIEIEENYDHQGNDAIYFREGEFLVKYKIKELLDKNNSKVKNIWKIKEPLRHGMAIRMDFHNQTQLFKFNCFEKRMEIFDTMDGTMCGHFTLENVSLVMDILFITPNKMIISDFNAYKCFIFEKVSENNWKLIKEIEEANNVKIFQPLGMTIDRVGKRVFVSDNGNQRLIILDCEGNVLTTFNYPLPNMELNPCGLCFDDRTGLLYVTDQENSCVRIFK